MVVAPGHKGRVMRWEAKGDPGHNRAWVNDQEPVLGRQTGKDRV